MTNEERAWLEARRSGIGGSDASCVVGMNPWKSNVDLWREKVGLFVPEDISDKPAVKYGKAAESHLRALFELDHPECIAAYDQYGMIANDPASISFPASVKVNCGSALTLVVTTTAGNAIITELYITVEKV